MLFSTAQGAKNNPTTTHLSDMFKKKNDNFLAAPVEHGGATIVEESQKQIAGCKLEGSSDSFLTFQGQHTPSGKFE